MDWHLIATLGLGLLLGHILIVLFNAILALLGVAGSKDRVTPT